MDVFGVLYLDELAHGLANLSMFPYFDMAHYVVSVMALREQPGKSSANCSCTTHPGFHEVFTKFMGTKRLFEKKTTASLSCYSGSPPNINCLLSTCKQLFSFNVST